MSVEKISSPLLHHRPSYSQKGVCAHKLDQKGDQRVACWLCEEQKEWTEKRNHCQSGPMGSQSGSVPSTQCQYPVPSTAQSGPVGSLIPGSQLALVNQYPVVEAATQPGLP